MYISVNLTLLNAAFIKMLYELKTTFLNPDCVLSLLPDPIHSSRNARFSWHPWAKPPVWSFRLWLGIGTARVWSCRQLCGCSIQGAHTSPYTCTTYCGSWDTEPDKPVLQTTQVLSLMIKHIFFISYYYNTNCELEFSQYTIKNSILFSTTRKNVLKLEIKFRILFQ